MDVMALSSISTQVCKFLSNKFLAKMFRFCIDLSDGYHMDGRGRKQRFKSRVPGTYCLEIYTTKYLERPSSSTCIKVSYMVTDNDHKPINDEVRMVSTRVFYHPTPLPIIGP